MFQTCAKPESRTSCTLIPGDGVGPELMYSVQEVFRVSYILCKLLICAIYILFTVLFFFLFFCFRLPIVQ